jgi:hypothetical protein
VALQGTLDTFALPDVLRLLAATKKTGRLRVSGSRGNGSVWVFTGSVVGTEASGAPHATEAVEVVFELLRFAEGSFTFDVDEQHPDPGVPGDVEPLLEQAEQLLEEWRSIESVVPSLDAWVQLARELRSEVTVSPERWRALSLVGGGTSVRRIADELSIGEIPVCRSLKELAELGLVEISQAPDGSYSGLAPMGAVRTDDGLSARAELDALASSIPSGPKRRKPKEALTDADGNYVPLNLDHLGSPGKPAAASDNEPALMVAPTAAEAEAEVEVEAPVFPGLAAQAAAAAVEGDPDADEIARQLANLSPRAAQAVRAAAEATTDEARAAALASADDDEDAPLNRGLLLKFLSSVRS